MAEGRVPGRGVTAAAYRPSRSEAPVPAALLATVALGWLLTAERMSGMEAMPGGELGEPGWFAVS